MKTDKARNAIYITVYIGERDGIGAKRKEFLERLSHKEDRSASWLIVNTLEKHLEGFPTEK